MSKFIPFADDASVLSIGDLKFENGIELIAIHGSLDILPDRKGLESARAMRDALDDIVKTLEGMKDLPNEVPKAERSSETYDNPFGVDE